MKESLYYLFLSGLILGSGPCIGFCAPILAGFIAVYRPSLKKALISYLSFSSAKVLSYMILGGLCGIFAGIFKSSIFIDHLRMISITFGFLILFIGVLTVISKNPLTSKYCLIFSKGNLRNAGALGFLAGLSPCLPLLGILNYIIIISHSPFEGAFYAFVFGLGTAVSPVILLFGLSAKLSEYFSKNKNVKILIKIISSLLLIFMGLRIILG